MYFYLQIPLDRQENSYYEQFWNRRGHWWVYKGNLCWRTPDVTPDVFSPAVDVLAVKRSRPFIIAIPKSISLGDKFVSQVHWLHTVMMIKLSSLKNRVPPVSTTEPSE